MISNKKLHEAHRLISVGNFSAAINILSLILKKIPKHKDCLMLRGEAYLRNEQFEEALIDYAIIVELENKNLLALNNFSTALIKSRKFNEAREIILYVRELDPKNYAALINLGAIHQHFEEHHEALSTSMIAVELNPQAAEGYQNLGTALAQLGQFEAAREAYLMVKTLEPSNVLAYINLAQTEEKLGNFLEAKKLYEETLLLPNILRSQTQIVKYYLSYSYLFFGDIVKGWEFYEYGFDLQLPKNALRSLRKFEQPLWDGKKVGMKKLLVWREQGLGDEIVFSTCLHDVASQCMDVILECDPRLIPAYQRTFPNWVVRPETIDLDGYPYLSDFDIQCPIGSLPRFFRNKIGDFNNQKQLFYAEQNLKLKFAKLLYPFKDKTLVGISWRGGLLSATRNKHYTSIKDWGEIFQLPNCQFVNLQYGDSEEELQEVESLYGIKILRWSNLDLKNDLESVMALIVNLDYVVSVETAVSTIAPALGVTTLLLTLPQWLMLGEKNNFPWFDSLHPLVANKDEMVANKLKLAANIISKK
jgi:tetratricopeptide (TPR) repeat protein